MGTVQELLTAAEVADAAVTTATTNRETAEQAAETQIGQLKAAEVDATQAAVEAWTKVDDALAEVIKHSPTHGGPLGALFTPLLLVASLLGLAGCRHASPDASDVILAADRIENAERQIVAEVQQTRALLEQALTAPAEAGGRISRFEILDDELGRLNRNLVLAATALQRAPTPSACQCPKPTFPAPAPAPAAKPAATPAQPPHGRSPCPPDRRRVCYKVPAGGAPCGARDAAPAPVCNGPLCQFLTRPAGPLRRFVPNRLRRLAEDFRRLPAPRN